jgi:putative oxidoreductase
MAIAERMDALNEVAEPLHWLGSPLALVTRLYVGWVFLKSGWLKVTDWETTTYLFRDEFRVPFLPPDAAALLGAAGELLFPGLLILGLFGRWSAMGLQLVNVMAVVSYAHVLFKDGFEAAIAQHYLWGFMLLMLMIQGPGKWSVDAWLARRDEANR